MDQTPPEEDEWESISESDSEVEEYRCPSHSVVATRKPKDTPHGAHYRAHATRKLRPYEGKRPTKRKRMCAWEHAMDTMKRGCGRNESHYCKLDCLSQRRTTPEQIIDIREKFFELGGEDEVSVWMARFFESSKKDNGRVRYHFGDGKEVCSKAWQRMYGISNDKMAAVHKRVAAGAPFPVMKPDSICRLSLSSHFTVGLPSPFRPAPLEVSIKDWMETYIHDYCDKLSCGSVHLPEFLQWEDLYEVDLPSAPRLEQTNNKTRTHATHTYNSHTHNTHGSGFTT